MRFFQRLQEGIGVEETCTKFAEARSGPLIGTLRNCAQTNLTGCQLQVT
jgi:hypothetical protein